jgi:hypothetical protein
MATNPPTGDGHRKGQVRDRSQTFNPRTEQYVKRDMTPRPAGSFKGTDQLMGIKKICLTGLIF